jgi:hypothetical protein
MEYAHNILEERPFDPDDAVPTFTSYTGIRRFVAYTKKPQSEPRTHEHNTT